MSTTAKNTVNLLAAPEWLHTGIPLFASETPVGWRYITADDGPGRIKPVGVLIITATGRFEADLDGIIVRAGMLHPIPVDPSVVALGALVEQNASVAK